MAVIFCFPPVLVILLFSCKTSPNAYTRFETGSGSGRQADHLTQQNTCCKTASKQKQSLQSCRHRSAKNTDIETHIKKTVFQLSSPSTQCACLRHTHITRFLEPWTWHRQAVSSVPQTHVTSKNIRCARSSIPYASADGHDVNRNFVRVQWDQSKNGEKEIFFTGLHFIKCFAAADVSSTAAKKNLSLIFFS